MFRFVELFAGGGLARLGLGSAWTCVYANDLSEWKAATYRSNFGGDEFVLGNIKDIFDHDIPAAKLRWASFPCQDHSTAGRRLRFDGERGSLVFHVTRLLHAARSRGTAPDVLVLENVAGFATGAEGHDLASLVTELVSTGYRVGCLAVDAADFLPQSRLRLFLVAVRPDRHLPPALYAQKPNARWTLPAVSRAVAALRPFERKNWIWWTPPAPPLRCVQLRDVLETTVKPSLWREADNVAALVRTMRPADTRRLDQAMSSQSMVYGTVVLRPAQTGSVAGRSLALRVDGVAGCLMGKTDLRYQQLCRIADGRLDIRPFTAIELARLMGLPPECKLPASLARTAKLTGDGVAVPVVRWLALTLLAPLLKTCRNQDSDVLRPRTEQLPGAARVSPKRIRKAISAGSGTVPARLKAATRGTTLYLLPNEMERLQSVAYGRGVSVHEYVLQALDRSLAELGERPISRPAPSRKRCPSPVHSHASRNTAGSQT